MATTTKDQILGNTNPSPTAPPNGYTKQGGGENVQQGTGDARSGDLANANEQHNNGGTNTAVEGNPNVKQQSGNTAPVTDGSNVAPQEKQQTQNVEQPTSGQQEQPQKENNPFPTSTPDGYTRQGSEAPAPSYDGAGTTDNSSSNASGTPEKKSLTYEEMWEQMNPYKAPTPEEVEQEKKKQKRRALWAAIGDGVSALANLYFVGKGAPNLLDPNGTTMSAKVQERADKLKKEREDNQLQYLNGYMRSRKWDEDAAAQKDALAYQRGRDAVKDAQEKEKNEWLAKLYEARANGANADADYKQAHADRERVLADAQKELSDAILAEHGAKTEAQKAAAKARLKTAQAAWLRAQKYNGGGSGGSRSSSGGGKGGSGKYYGSLTVAGKTYNYKTKADYDKAVSNFAKQYGVSEQDITYEYSNGNTKLGEKRKQRQVHDVAADVEKKSKPQPKPKPQQAPQKKQVATPKQPHQQGGSGKKKTGVKWT